ncbi:NRDE family protein [Enterovibrio makurazakiensis]|uniref:NRDE family protein n=1 Tax=Enterovibrio gelatinilyticus TaxID=2899819 RepID=A0ABT5R619_9GAMM|nr:NRDE family protein [Enterovibrio sp. ZSDZ42]MDD1795434.1 NRDE family protein [Enterovibrio sp. ZSDZ42]
MCTVSWLLHESGYDVFFNRDEQKGRAIAHPPQLLSQGNTSFLMPVDPDGGGTWMATNHNGLSLCLLNYYQGDIPELPLISRGLLVKMLAPSLMVSDVVSTLNNLHLGSYAPFTLLVFAPDLSSTHGHVIAFQWDGHVLTQRPSIEPMISSSVAFTEVMQARRQAHNIIMTEPRTIEKAWEFHRSHVPEAGYKSVCMHRDDANTVSFTHLKVTPEHVEMIYVDGPPCQKGEAVRTLLGRQSLSLRLAASD